MYKISSLRLRLPSFLPTATIASARHHVGIARHLLLHAPKPAHLLPRFGSSNAAPDKHQPDQSYVNINRDATTRVFTLSLNRPEKLNALDRSAWDDLRCAFEGCDSDPACRAIVLHGGTSKHFCAGLDVQSMASTFSPSASSESDVARNGFKFSADLRRYQDAFNAIERCRKPVIAAIHGACIGAGVELISAADIRYCSSDAYFEIKEVAMGLAADGGALQRFPKQTGNDSLVRELLLTSRRCYANEAQHALGFVSRILCDREHLLSAANDLAVLIAAKSPVAVQGTKVNLNYSRDHTVQEGLEFVKTWNMGMLQTEDLITSIMRGAGKKGDKHEKASDFKDV